MPTLLTGQPPQRTLQGVGWWSFRVRDLEAARHFYTRLGFREIEGAGGPTWFHLDGGDGSWINIGTLTEGTAPHPPVTNRMNVRVTPIFRVYDLDGWIERARAVGAGLQERVAFGPTRILYLTDPANNLLGFQERGGPDDDPLEQDLRRQWEAGNRGDGLQILGWVVVRLADIEAGVRFYQQLGFTLFNRTAQFAQLDAGNGTILNLSPLGPDPAPNPAITDRNSMTRCPIYRAYGFQDLVVRARLAGAGLQQRIDPPGGHILYLTDPEGNPFALQERTTDSDRPIDHTMRARMDGQA